MNKKEVLFLCSWYPSRENPTLGNFVEKHAQCSSEVANVTVLYAVSSTQVNQVTFEENNVDGVKSLIVYYPKRKSKIPLLSSLLKLKDYKDALRKGFQKLNTEFDLVQLNVAFAAGTFALELKREYDLPYIVLAHWTGYLSHTNSFAKQPFYIRSLHRKIFSQSEHVLCVSEHLGESLKGLGLINSYSVFPNVVERKHFYPDNVNKESDELRILHISSFDDQHKNISGMMSAIATLKRPYHLNLITETSIEKVELFLDKVGISRNKVSIQSRIDAELIGNTMRQSDVMVLFSNYETFSVVMAEAWMSGLPIIYSKCGGLTEIEDKRLGIQIKKGNSQSLIRAIENFDTNNYDENTITKFALQFEREALATRIGEIYQKY